MIFALAALAVCLCQLEIDRRRRETPDQDELMYFPSARFTRTAAFGYDNLIGDCVWLDIIQYYGRHSLSDMQYRYLKHMLNVLVALVPRFTNAYTFGALLLITDGNDQTGAFDLLETGLRRNPTEGSIAFTRGFFHYVFLKDYREASRWFAIASRMPGAPEMAGRFAAFARQKGHDLATARALWLEVRNKSRNPTERLMAEGYIAKIDRTLLLQQLQRRADEFRSRAGRPPHSLYELVGAGLLAVVPQDPMGGRFTVDRSSGKVSAVGGHTPFNQ
ncbi:MAG: hypothetical protein QME74_08960 [Candidatus Edwardsbacteria bacterium]|nr:hypothetical protein [Candidatus Edwardsbacteria bacterium]